MEFWNNAAMGSLSGMMAGGMGRGINSRAQLAHLDARIGAGQFQDTHAGEGRFETSPFLLNKAPSFPGSALDRLRNRLFEHNAARENMINDMKTKLEMMKEVFYESHSLETVTGEDGKPKVMQDENGSAVVLQTKENPVQRGARQEFEQATKQALNDVHVNEKETFLKEEKQQIQNFLQTHRNDLGNPAVQIELQKMIILTQKKALKLQQDHEEESWKVDLPTEEMQAFVDEETRKLREMDKKHKDIEDSSQEAKELIMYQEELNKIMGEEKEKSKSKEMDEVFLKGPSAYLKPPPPPSLSSVLPPYLTEALYNMGIYSVD